MKGEICSLVFALVFVPILVFGWMNALHSLRMRRVRRLYESLPPDVLHRCLDLIDTAGAANTACRVLVALPVSEDWPGAQEPHFGGRPYAEQGEAWPKFSDETGQPADFLIQVILDDSLGFTWGGRLVTIFTRNDVHQTVRCHASPSPASAVELDGGPPPLRPWRFKSIRIPRFEIPDAPVAAPEAAETATTEVRDPVSSSSGLLDYDPVLLLKSVEGLEAELTALTRRPADLLAAILAPNHCGYGFELSDIVQMGGQPVWLQADPGPQKCDACGCTQQFLFQFGDLNGGALLGDAGVCYVFGCDDHPERLKALVQSA